MERGCRPVVGGCHIRHDQTGLRHVYLVDRIMTPTTCLPGWGVEPDKYTSIPPINGDQVTGGSTEATKFTYDAPGSHGQVTAVTDPGQNQRTYTFNLLGQQTSQSDPDSGTTYMTYDADGYLRPTKDSRGKTISLDYDVLGRKTVEYDGPDSSAPKLTSWTYDDPAVPDSIGRQTSSAHRRCPVRA